MPALKTRRKLKDPARERHGREGKRARGRQAEGCYVKLSHGVCARAPGGAGARAGGDDARRRHRCRPVLLHAMMRRPLCLRKRAAQPCGGRRTRYRTAAPSFRAKLIPGGQPLPAACSASRTKDAAGDIPVSIRRHERAHSERASERAREREREREKERERESERESERERARERDQGGCEAGSDELIVGRRCVCAEGRQGTPPKKTGVLRLRDLHACMHAGMQAGRQA